MGFFGWTLSFSESITSLIMYMPPKARHRTANPCSAAREEAGSSSFSENIRGMNISRFLYCCCGRTIVQ